jgi:hypothetical protein
MKISNKGLIIVQKTNGESLNYYEKVCKYIVNHINSDKIKLTQNEIEKVYNDSKKSVSTSILGCNYY